MCSRTNYALKTEKHVQLKSFLLEINSHSFKVETEQGAALQTGHNSQPITDTDMKVDVCDWLAFCNV